MTVHAYAWKWIAKRGIRRVDVKPEHYVQIRNDWEAYECRVFRLFAAVSTALTLMIVVMLPTLWTILIVTTIAIIHSYFDLAKRIYL